MVHRHNYGECMCIHYKFPCATLSGFLLVAWQSHSLGQVEHLCLSKPDPLQLNISGEKHTSQLSTHFKFMTILFGGFSMWVLDVARPLNYPFPITPLPCSPRRIIFYLLCFVSLFSLSQMIKLYFCKVIRREFLKPTATYLPTNTAFLPVPLQSIFASIEN